VFDFGHALTWVGRRTLCWLALGIFAAGALAGCISPQVHSTVEHRAISLKPGDLRTHGLAFITPSTVTGQEEDKQTLALVFAAVVIEELPGVPCLTLPETLGAINKAGLAEEYKRMYADYRDTGIFARDILRKVGKVAGTRYLGQLKLAGFSQGSQGRWGLMGIRVLQTKQTNIRLFFQIWDSIDGTIAWEGVQELNYAYDTAAETPVTFKTVVEQTARNLIRRLP